MLVSILFVLKCTSELAEEQAEEFLKKYEVDASLAKNKLVSAEYEFVKDLNNEEKEQRKVKETLNAANFTKTHWKNVFSQVNLENFKNESIKRQLTFLKELGNAALDEDKLTKLTEYGNLMIKIYGTAKICPYHYQTCAIEEEGLSLEPDIEAIFRTSTDYDELKYVWEAWHNATGRKIKRPYKEYVALSNEVAKLNNFTDKGEMWKNEYESETFEEDINRLWEQVKPLYDELHAYVGLKLKNHYGSQLDIDDGLIPAHLFGNVWAQSWTNLQWLVRPYPDADTINVTSALLKQNYKPRKMFEVADNFYKSVGLQSSNISYDELLGAVIIKPGTREILCHASAWDFFNAKKFSIKMCTKEHHEDFITIHHEMGHIQYFTLYKNQPIAFRKGANPSLPEAIGDAIALSVVSPKHLQKINLLENYTESYESQLNALMDMALERVAFLPFAFLVDKWRWDVFSDKVNETEWNKHWWDYRRKFQKIKEPISRSSDDFDPGAKYHVPADAQYIKYFVGHILEFQLYRSFCKEAGEYKPGDSSKPLHNCDFYNERKIGDKLKDGLQLGASTHWKNVLKKMINENDIDGSAILEYFKPLYDYLQLENLIHIEDKLNALLANQYEDEASEVNRKTVVADWNASTDINNVTKQNALLNATLELGKFSKNYWVKFFKNLPSTNYKNETLKRQVQLLKILGQAALDDEKFEKLMTDVKDMKNIYRTAKVCPYMKQSCDLEKEGLKLEPDLRNVLAESSDYDELKYVWTKWREASGKKMKETYQNYVKLSNEAAVENGFADTSGMWRSFYESDTFETDIENIWNQVKPLYDELHSYVANKLKKYYGDKLDVEDGLIPAHILGNMWAQSWINIGHLVTPYPNATTINVTAALIEKGYTALKMFEVSNEFYLSLGLESNSVSYGNLTIIVKPEDREILCDASAWNFYDGKDYRIKMCTEVNYKDFLKVYQKMGQIQYFILYKDQPIALQNGANPSFHEAIGGAIALSVATSNHLQRIGLLNSYNETEETDINNLMDMALEKIAFLPFGYLIDKWRWDVFSGKVNFSEWNERWWHYRETIQKLKPPEQRSPDDFDPGAKYHVAGDSQYINYFIAHILEFQLYRSMCKTAKQYDPKNSSLPLYKCDFYQSKEVGQKLRNGMSLGASKHWKDVLKEMTGETDLDATAILEYFDPLLKYLKEENLKCYLRNTYEKEASRHTNDLVHAEWNFVTDVANKTAEEEQLAVKLEVSKYNKDVWTNVFHNLNEDDYSDDVLKRQIKILKVVGNAALEEDKLSELSAAVNHMTNIYNTAKICPYSKPDCSLQTDGLALEPGIESILAKSRNYKELVYVWSKWRDATGVKIKETYKKYVKLSNEAAVINGFKDKGELWRSAYESPNFINNTDKLWNQVKPLYEELHKYVRTKLRNEYPEFDGSDGLIPAHLFGNMWAQSWTNLFSLVKPYPDSSTLNITQGLQNNNYTPLKMFETSNEFYMSLGLESNAMSYDESLGAVIVKPPDRDILCHASAFDFSNGKDFRIKMCTEVNHEHFMTIHRQMGHIQYFIQYKDQPKVFRDSANPSFHDAIGNAIALSAATSDHLKTIDLLENYEDTPEESINTLIKTALETVAFLPFGLLVDKWRWDVFNGKVNESEWNSLWWKYRKEYQGIKPPLPRTEIDFDPGAQFHVPSDSPYIQYFVARILQFQIYKGLCKKAGQYSDEKHLHKCDFYNSTAVGVVLKKALSLGLSKHWTVALKEMTGEDMLTADALVEYFEPLMQYLRAQHFGSSTTVDGNNSIIPIVIGSIVGTIVGITLVGALGFFGYKKYNRISNISVFKAKSITY
ncbi:hypothetical protein FQR65_LT08466 [Abscondita terminalis]|nr:hypothetical protein FQR65_LT08466 [Abscondita terminalis]